MVPLMTFFPVKKILIEARLSRRFGLGKEKERKGRRERMLNGVYKMQDFSVSNLL